MEGDASLATGVHNPTTFGNEDLQSPEVKAELKRQRDQALQLIPAAQTVLDAIEVERAKVNDFGSFLTATLKTNKGKVDDTKLTIEARAREMHLGFLDQLKSTIIGRLESAKQIRDRADKNERNSK